MQGQTLERLPRLVQEEFRKLPLSKALEQLGESAALNVLIDARAEKKAEVEVTARLTNVPADTAIRLLADMAGLEVVRVNNVLYVTTPENAEKLRKKLAAEAGLGGPRHGTKSVRPGGV